MHTGSTTWRWGNNFQVSPMLCRWLTMWSNSSGGRCGVNILVVGSPEQKASPFWHQEATVTPMIAIPPHSLIHSVALLTCTCVRQWGVGILSTQSLCMLRPVMGLAFEETVNTPHHGFSPCELEPHWIHLYHQWNFHQSKSALVLGHILILSMSCHEKMKSIHV